MVEQGLVSLAAALRPLTAPTAGSSVAEGLVTGPLAGISAVAAVLMHAVDENLVRVGSYGYAESDIDGWETMAIAADLPICLAYRDGEVVVTSTIEAKSEYSDISSEPTRWDRYLERYPRGSIVSVPLVSQGVPVGCLGFQCSEDRVWGPDSLSLLESVASVLAMWMTHPISGLPPGRSWAAPGPVVLTSRQVEVLRLSSEGRTTAQIAETLAYSESTVKQELRRALRMLETTDRAIAVQRARLLGLLDGAAS